MFWLKILYDKIICFVIQHYVDHLKLVCKEGGCTLVPVYLQGSQESLVISVSIVWWLIVVFGMLLPQEKQFLDVCRGVCQACHIFVALLGATSTEWAPVYVELFVSVETSQLGPFVYFMWLLLKSISGRIYCFWLVKSFYVRMFVSLCENPYWRFLSIQMLHLHTVHIYIDVYVYT